MQTLLLAAVAASALLVSSAASAALVGDFQLNNSLANGAAADLTANLGVPRSAIAAGWNAFHFWKG